MALAFKARLALWHMVAAAAILAVAAVAAHAALSHLVPGTVIDEAILSLAETEASLLTDPHIRVHEKAPDTAPPSFARLDKFVQIVDLLEGQIVARSTTLGTARLPLSSELLSRLRAAEVVFPS